MTHTDSDRGAILIHTAFALMGLILFSAFVADYGTFWVGRAQTQNTADAAALAGAVARAYDDPTDPPASKATGVIYDSVVSAAQRSRIWGQTPPANTLTLDWTCPDLSTKCVAVDVYRDGTHNSTPLPTFFMRFVGVNTQGTKAHAVAMVSPANHFSGCIRPWFAEDLYNDANHDDHFDLSKGDTYTPLGYKLPDDLGTEVDLHNNTGPSGYGQIDVGQGNSANGLEDIIEHCAPGFSLTIGVPIPTVPGGKVGKERSGTDQLVAWDPNAHWVQADKKIEGSCAETNSCTCDGTCPNGPGISPRVVVAPVCSPLEQSCADGGPSNHSITPVNILAFFVDGNTQGNGNDLIVPARLIGQAGEISSSGGSAPSGSFLTSILLVR